MSAKPLATIIVMLISLNSSLAAAEWQWSVADGKGRAYLWIPPTCERVRGVVLACNNMIEMGILEHPRMRSTLSELGFAEVWVTPSLDLNFDFTKGAGEHFDRVMTALADESGYDELKVAPVVPLGHSAHATFPWNFAAWNPVRTLCVLSVKGDAPQTTLTGYGRANVDWENRGIDGVPGVMVMSEQEWWDDRLKPAMKFREEHPAAPIAAFAEVGEGHFGFSDQLVEFLAMFVRKSAENRLPANISEPKERPVVLRSMDPQQAWLVDRWRKDSGPVAPAAPFDQYTGDRSEAFFCFDVEMARFIESEYARIHGKKPQLLGFAEGDRILAGEPCTPRVITHDDGVTFRLTPAFLDRIEKTNGKGQLWTGLPAGSSIGHAMRGAIQTRVIIGPVRNIKDDLFEVSLNRSVYCEDRRNTDAWICLAHPGDDEYKPAAQQGLLKVMPNKEGEIQSIQFETIADQKLEIGEMKLNATATSGLPVRFYLREGPAEINGNSLRLLPLPPRTKLPVRITVVAWQWGRSAEPKVKTAKQAERSFFIAS